MCYFYLQRSIEQARAKRKRYRKNKLELKGLKKRWKERREAYERREREIEKEKFTIDTSSDESSSYTEPDNIRVKEVCKSEVRVQYAKLQESSTIDAMSSDNHNSLLLPSFVRPREKLKVFVEGASDTMQGIASKITAQQCITKLSKERDDALEMARSYRNCVDELRARNRKLYCEMNDRIDLIRNFWRNNIAEGSTRAGLCVQMAIKSSTK